MRFIQRSTSSLFSVCSLCDRSSAMFSCNVKDKFSSCTSCRVLANYIVKVVRRGWITPRSLALPFNSSSWSFMRMLKIAFSELNSLIRLISCCDCSLSVCSSTHMLSSRDCMTPLLLCASLKSCRALINASSLEACGTKFGILGFRLRLSAVGDSAGTRLFAWESRPAALLASFVSTND